MGPSDAATHSDAAKRVFAALLARLEDDATFDVAGALSQQPELEGELRELHARWLRVDRALAGLGGRSSVLDSIERELAGREPASAELREAFERIARRVHAAERYVLG